MYPRWTNFVSCEYRFVKLFYGIHFNILLPGPKNYRREQSKMVYFKKQKFLNIV